MGLALLDDLWRDSEIEGMDEPELLRYRSNLLGRDLRLTNFGGGNTSAKLIQTDPVTGEDVEILWVKGSGGDLGTIKRDGFATLYQSKLQGLKNRYRGNDHEDEMVDLYPLCTFGLNPRAASIDTPLHAFLPFSHVDHLHPDWAIALAAAANGQDHLKRLRDEFGLNLIWLPWKRPGFELGLWLESAVKEQPDADGIILASHGLFTWGDTGRQSYLNTLRVIDTIGQYVRRHVDSTGSKLFGGAAYSDSPEKQRLIRNLMPALRGLTGSTIGHFDDRPEVMRFINSSRGKALAWQGTSCPDHFVRTKVRPLYVDWNPAADSEQALLAAIRQGFDQYREDYAAYYEENKLPDSPPIRSASPSVVLVPGVGLFSFAKNKPEARITAEFYVNAIHVMEGATALDDPTIQRPNDPRVVDNYVALPPREAFNIEYWQLEEAKLRRMPPEKELSRKVALVVGASAGIGRAISEKLASNGAHIVVADLNAELAQECVAAVQSSCGQESAAAASVDVTNRESVRQLMDTVVRTYGGVGIVVCTVAVYFPPDESTGRITDEQWRKTQDVNLLGSMIVADEAHKLMREQATLSREVDTLGERSGSIILLSSANALVPKKGSWAYDSGKAALNHLVREMAVEFAPSVRVNGVAPASVVEGSIQFPRERVLDSLAKYNLPFEESESTEMLRDRLSQYYAQRSLLKRKVTPQDVAEAVFLLASNRLGATTGQILAVDSGLTEAFLR